MKLNRLKGAETKTILLPENIAWILRPGLDSALDFQSNTEKYKEKLLKSKTAALVLSHPDLNNTWKHLDQCYHISEKLLRKYSVE